MCFGNGLGFSYSEKADMNKIFGYSYAGFILEVADWDNGDEIIGTVTEKGEISYLGDTVSLDSLLKIYEDKLESVFTCNIKNTGSKPENVSYTATERTAPSIKVAKPRVLIPVFPGTNCEYDSAKAVANAGADEPDGSGKFITAFFRNPEIKEGVTELLEHRDGLMCGICNGFQALIKLGLVPYGKIIDTDENCPTLTFNTIARHQSRIVRTRIASNKSPWLSEMNVGDIVNVPISHGEGRFLANDETIRSLIENGQIATQYVDSNGNASNDIRFNPNDSAYAIEGITSPDGRVFGKMGHSERIGAGLYKNVPGNYNIHMFESAVKYFNK